jgi:hypothetical protein
MVASRRLTKSLLAMTVLLLSGRSTRDHSLAAAIANRDVPSAIDKRPDVGRSSNKGRRCHSATLCTYSSFPS